MSLSTSSRLEQERQKRDKYLHRKVQETLCLQLPELATEKVCAHGTYSLNLEEQKASARQYQNKLRTNRILQVRAQEMLFASQRIAKFRDRKSRHSKMLINHLKEVWSKDQKRRIASLEEEFANACQSIGLSHNAAQLVERNRAAKEELLARHAEESRCWDALRFEEAMQKEREQKELRERGESASTLRRKIVESVSSIERSFARRYNQGTKSRPKPQEKQAFGCSQAVNLPVDHDGTREKIYSRLAGFPIDFKDTYLHSRFDVLKDCTNQPSSAMVSCHEQEEIDAWRAADAQRERSRSERACQIELKRLYNERKLERGSAAAAKLLNDQRIAMLEQEVEEAFREEEREQDRLHVVTNLGTCKRAASAGQERHPICIKHKISNPLSCPGESMIIGSLEDLQEITPENETLNTNVVKKPKPLQEHVEKQDLSKIDIQGKRIQLADLVSYQSHQGALLRQEVERELSGNKIINHKLADGREANPSQLQINATDADGLILAPVITKSLQHSSVQIKRKGISPIRASCERAELNTPRNEEGSVMKQPRVKSPHKLKQNSGNERTGKRQFNTSERVEDDIARRWRAWEKERDNESWIEDLSENASPGKIQYHMELVREAAEVEKEVELFKKRVPLKRTTHNIISRIESGERQRSQRYESPSITRPPFISSGTIGYKKILIGPIMQPQNSRPASESEWNKAEPKEERASIIRSVRENFNASLSNTQRVPDLDIVKENMFSSSPRERHRPLFRPHTSSSSRINKNNLETSRSWAHPIRPHSRHLNPQEQYKALKTVNGAKWACHEDQPNDDQGLKKDSASKGVGRDSASPKNRNKANRSFKSETSNVVVNDQLLFVVGKPREDNSRKSDSSERVHEKRVHEQRPRQKAAWKSYIDEKNQVVRKKLETPTENRLINSEPSSPPAQTKRCINSRFKRPVDQQDDYQLKARLEQQVGYPKVRNCHTPTTSVKSLPNSRLRFVRESSVPRSMKYSQANSKEIEVEALENVSTKIKSLSKRFHSPVIQIPQGTSPLKRNRKDLNSKETSFLPTGFSVRKEKPRKFEDISSASEVVPLQTQGNLTERAGSTRVDVGLTSASNDPNMFINAWKTGTFQDDYDKAMKQAKEITNGSRSLGISKIYLDQNYNKPWLSRSPFRRNLDQEFDDVSQDSHIHNQRIVSTNPKTNHKSSMTLPNKPWLSNSPSRRSPDHIDDQDYYEQNYRSGSANPKRNNKSPITHSNVTTTMLSPKRLKLTSRPLWGPEFSRSSPLKSRARGEQKKSTRDPWEGQSLDFVLGSLAEQVRELDESLRSATISSPALSSSSSFMSRDFYVKRDEQNVNQSSIKMPTKPSKDRGSPSSFVASSPKRRFRAINCGPPATRVYTNGNVGDLKDSAYRAIVRPTSAGTYMNELKMLLREISSNNASSPIRRNHVNSCHFAQKAQSENKSKNIRDIAMKPEILRMDKIYATQPKPKAEFEAGFVSSTSVSSDILRTNPVTSQRDVLKTKVMLVGKEKASVVGNGLVNRASANGQLDLQVMHGRFYGNGHTKPKGERERASDLVTERISEAYEKKNVLQENGFREDNGIRRVLEKRLIQSRWNQRQVAKSGLGGLQEKLEKRTIEVRGCASHQIIHGGHVVVKEQLVKKVVENGLASPDINGHGKLKKNEVTLDRGWDTHNDGNHGKGTAVKQKKDVQEFSVPRQVHSNAKPETNEIVKRETIQPQRLQQVLPNGKPATNELGEREVVQSGGFAGHAASNGHTIATENLRRLSMLRMEDQARNYALSNGGEKLRNRQPENPLLGEESPHCPENWRKGGLNLDEEENRMLLSGSVDFSPWNTEKLPDIGTPQPAAKDRNRSKPPSPIAEDTSSNGSLASKNLRTKPPPKVNKTFGQKFVRKNAVPNGEHFFHPNPAPVRESVSAPNSNALKTQVREKLMNPKPVPRGVDALWSLSDQDVALHPSAAQNGNFPPRRKTSPGPGKIPPRMNERRTAFVLKSRLVKEQSSSQEEMPDSASKSSQDDNYLPVIMAKDPESRQRVIERRKKALQLDMEHRQRLRNSRPSSARSCV